MVEKYDSTEREAERPKFLLEEKETYVPDFARDDEAGGASNESKEPKNAAGVNQGALRELQCTVSWSVWISRACVI